MKKTFFNRYNLILLFVVFLIAALNIIFVIKMLIPNYNAAIIFSTIGFSIFFVSIISINRIFFISFFIIVLFFGTMMSYFQIFFGIYFNEAILENILSTNYEEASTFISYKLISWMIAFWLIPTLFFLSKSKWLKIEFKKKLKHACLFSFIGAILFYMPMLFLKAINPIVFLQHITAVNLYPANFIVTFKTYYKHETFKANSKKLNPFLNYKFEFYNKDITIVLVIGESARSDRFSINGYSRDTTPNLKKQANLISFKDAYSLGTYTIIGVKNIFKLHPQKNENTLISLFNNLGFKSIWMSMQSFVNNINQIASESQKLVTRKMILQKNDYNIKDENLLPYLKEALQDNKSENKLIILHTQGSHRTYDDKYPEKFKKFIPTCTNVNENFILKRLFKRNSCEHIEESNNSYDNNIFYTDYVLNKIIEELKPYKSIFVFISDHGESLGENGIFLHSHAYKTAPKEQLHIPYMLWFSQKLLDQNPELKKNMEIAKDNIDKRVDQSTIIHSLLDCVNIKSNLIDKRKSICSNLLGENVVFGRK